MSSQIGEGRWGLEFVVTSMLPLKDKSTKSRKPKINEARIIGDFLLLELFKFYTVLCKLRLQKANEEKNLKNKKAEKIIWLGSKSKFRTGHGSKKRGKEGKKERWKERKEKKRKEKKGRRERERGEGKKGGRRK